MTSDDTARRHATFIEGKTFTDHIDTVDKLCAAVMTDIVNRSFGGIDWIVDIKKVDRTAVLVPIRPTDATMIPFAISAFDTQTSPASDRREQTFTMKRVAMGDFHYAWAGDEMAYIDRVASALFMQQQ